MQCKLMRDKNVNKTNKIIYVANSQASVFGFMVCVMDTHYLAAENNMTIKFDNLDKFKTRGLVVGEKY